MGLWLNEPILSRPGRLDQAVHELADAGYGLVRVMLRNTNFSHRSPQVVEAVGRIVEIAHSRKIKVILDCEPHAEPAAWDMGNLYPDAIGMRVVRGEAELVNGGFQMKIRAPRGFGERSHFQGVLAAFVEQEGKPKRLEDFQVENHRIVTESYLNGFTTGSHSYREGRPADMQLWVHLHGRAPRASRGRLSVYASFFDPRVVDFWSEGCRRYYHQVLDCYRGIPLDGVGWDEPGQGGDWSHYLSGKSFQAAFEKLNGYCLNDRWAWLDAPEANAASAKVRLDYYRTLNEGIFQAQQNLHAKATELFGGSLIWGTHHTWQGEGNINDYRAGAVDYFRLNENMDAGYTDCWWWDQKSVCYAYTLGSSLGRLTQSGEAEINTWDAKPTIARTEFQSRLLTLFNLNWFNIWYGESTDTCVYPADYTWGATARATRRHHRDLLTLKGASPVTEVAILHGWETVCGINREDIAAAHKTFCLNTAELFVQRNVAFDWLDTRLLAESRIEGSRLTNALGTYSVVVLPYASILPRAAWEICRAFADAGGNIIFVGPPPDLNLEGESLSGAFAQMMEMPELTLADYLERIDAVCQLPTHRADQLDVCCELLCDPEQILISVEEEAHGLKHPGGNVVYLSDLDPRERLLDVVQSWLAPKIECYSDNILWRLYRQDGGEVLICVAKEGRHLHGVIRWEGAEITLESGFLAFLERENGTIQIRGAHEIIETDRKEIASSGL